MKVEFCVEDAARTYHMHMLTLPFDKHMLDKGVLACWHRDHLAERVENPNITGGVEIFPFELKNIVQEFILPKMPKYVDASNHYARQYNKCRRMVDYWKSGDSIVMWIKH